MNLMVTTNKKPMLETPTKKKKRKRDLNITLKIVIKS